MRPVRYMLAALPKWNDATAAHLLNHAGFGGAPSEIERIQKLGLDGAVCSFVERDWIPDPHPIFSNRSSRPVRPVHHGQAVDILYRTDPEMSAALADSFDEERKTATK